MMSLKDFRTFEIIEEKIKNCYGGVVCTGGSVTNIGNQYYGASHRIVWDCHDGDSVNADGSINYINRRIEYSEWLDPFGIPVK